MLLSFCHRMTQLQHGWGESRLKKNKPKQKHFHIYHQTNANWQWFSPCVIVNCVLTASHVNIRVVSPCSQGIWQNTGLWYHSAWCINTSAERIHFCCMHAHTRVKAVSFNIMQMLWFFLFSNSNSQRLPVARTCPSSQLPQGMPSVCSMGDALLEFLACTQRSLARKSWHKRPEIQACP